MANDTHGESGIKWTGFDLDGTLAEYDGWKGIEYIGSPIKPMCDLIKKLHSDGKLVKILTARVAPRKDGADATLARQCIRKWCIENLGFVPDITHEKDALMERLYDDRVVQVIPDTGITIEEAARKVLWDKKSPDVKALMDYLTE